MAAKNSRAPEDSVTESSGNLFADLGSTQTVHEFN
jgi:hypothetical protein